MTVPPRRGVRGRARRRPHGRRALRVVARSPGLRPPRRRSACGGCTSPATGVDAWPRSCSSGRTVTCARGVERDPDLRVRARRDARLREGLPGRLARRAARALEPRGPRRARAARRSASSVSAASARPSPAGRSRSTCGCARCAGSPARDRARGRRARAATSPICSRRADHLVLAAPATAGDAPPARRGGVRPVKPGVHLVNIARGTLVDQDALRVALDDGRVAMASLDTVDPEPLPDRSLDVLAPEGAAHARTCRGHRRAASSGWSRSSRDEPAALRRRRAARRTSSTSTRATEWRGAPSGAVVVGTGFGCRVHVPALRAAGFDVRRARRPRRGAHAAARRARLDVPHGTHVTSPRRAGAPGRRRGHDRDAARHPRRRSRSPRRAPDGTCCARSRSRSTRPRREAMLDAATSGRRHAPRRSRVPLGDRARDGRSRHRRRRDRRATASRRSCRTCRSSPTRRRRCRAWWFDPAAGGGWLGASGSHVVDQIRVWLGEFAEVSATLTVVSDARGRRRGLVHDPVPPPSPASRACSSRRRPRGVR